MAVPTVITDLSTTIASNVPAGSESPASLDDYQRAHAAFIAQLYANTVAATTVIVASATSTAIGAAISENVDISGTTTITSFDTVAEGINRKGRFTGALTLTHNATSLILPGTANITTAANDRYEARSLGSGNWIVTKYITSTGKAIVPTAITRDALPSGSILQVVQATTATTTTVSSTTYTDTTLTASITPYFNTSKILVIVTQVYALSRFTNLMYGGVKLVRGVTDIYLPLQDIGSLPYTLGLELPGLSPTAMYLYGITNISYLDSPATTSATTYKTQGAHYSSTGTPEIIFQPTGSLNNGTSTIILMEVAG